MSPSKKSVNIFTNQNCGSIKKENRTRSELNVVKPLTYLMYGRPNIFTKTYIK